MSIDSAKREGKESFVHKLFVVTDRAFAENRKCCKVLLGIIFIEVEHTACFV